MEQVAYDVHAEPDYEDGKDDEDTGEYGKIDSHDDGVDNEYP